LALDAKDIAQLSVICLGPELRTGLHVHQVNIDPHLISRFLDATLKDVRYPKLPCDFSKISRFALISLCRSARNHFQIPDLSEAREDFFLDTIGEISVIRIAAQILKGQDRDAFPDIRGWCTDSPRLHARHLAGILLSPKREQSSGQHNHDSRTRPETQPISLDQTFRAIPKSRVTRNNGLSREMTTNVIGEIRYCGITHFGFLAHREQDDRVEVTAQQPCCLRITSDGAGRRRNLLTYD